jgi:riboflavin synthase
MFTGIIEHCGTITRILHEGGNIHFTIASPISNDLKIDQSVSHDGVCLTVVAVDNGTHTVTAIAETLQRTNLGSWHEGGLVNLERAMLANARLDGHLVQGHVDDTALCIDRRDADGSWYYTFRYKPSPEHLLVDKGSICINGVSLTVVTPKDDTFSVAIIPYTFHHTTFQNLNIGDTINLEFDIIGKYLAKHLAVYTKAFNL